MSPLRLFMLRHRALAAAMMILALAMKLLIPAGFMPEVTEHSISMTICSGYGPMTMKTPAPQGRSDRDTLPGKSQTPCGFGVLAAPALASADPLLLALAIAFIIALGVLAAPTAILTPRVRLRPPAIGPPLLS